MDIQAIRDQIIKELELLEAKYEEITSNRDTTIDAYHEINSEVREKEEALDDLIEQKDELPYKNHNKIDTNVEAISAVLAILVIFATTTLIGIPILQIKDLLQSAILWIGLTISNVLLVSIIRAKVTNKIKNKLKTKSYNKIIESEDYQNLLKQIKEQEQQLKEARNIKANISLTLEDDKIKYDTYTREINNRKSFIEYIDQILRTEKYDELTETTGRARTKSPQKQ